MAYYNKRIFTLVLIGIFLLNACTFPSVADSGIEGSAGGSSSSTEESPSQPEEPLEISVNLAGRALAHSSHGWMTANWYLSLAAISSWAPMAATIPNGWLPFPHSGFTAQKLRTACTPHVLLSENVLRPKTSSRSMLSTTLRGSSIL